MAGLSKRRGKDKDKRPRRRKTLVLLTDLVKRLEAAAVDEGVTASDIVEHLLEERLSGYTVSVRGRRLALGRDRRTVAGEVSGEAAEAA